MTNQTINAYTTPQTDFDEDDDTIRGIETGKTRVMRLLLITVFFVALACLIIFGLIPYVESLNQPTVPPLPPAIHT